jgi:hypothetical protein
MKHPTDEWLIMGIDKVGLRRRFVIHHDPEDSFLHVVNHAMSTAISTWGGSWHQLGHGVTILSITNQEAE